MKVLNFYSKDFSLKNDKEKVLDIPSLTIPDQSMTVRQLLEKYQNTGEFMNARGQRFDIPDSVSDDDADNFLMYNDEPDDLILYDELSQLVSSHYDDVQKKVATDKLLAEKKLADELKAQKDEEEYISRKVRVTREINKRLKKDDD